MKKIRFEGQVHVFPDDFTDADIANALGSSEPKTQKSDLSKAASGFWSYASPVAVVEGLTHAALSPKQTVKDILASHVEQLAGAAYSAQKGRYVEALGHAGAAALPVLGPMAAKIGEKIANTGDVATGVGEGAGLVATLGYTPNGIKRVAGVAKKAAPIVGDATRAAVGEAASAVAPAAAAEAATSMAGFPGAGSSAVLAYRALKAVPEVYKAVKAGIAERRGISGAAAERTLIEMTPEDLAATVQEVAPKAYDENFRSHSPAVSPEKAARRKRLMEDIERRRKEYWEKNPKGHTTPVPAKAEPLGSVEVNLPKGEGPYPELTPEQLAQIERDLQPGGKYGPGRAGETLPEPTAPPVVTVPGETGPRVVSNPNLVDKTGRPLDLTPEQRAEIVANLPWNKGKASKPAPVEVAESKPTPKVSEPVGKPQRVDHFDPSLGANVREWIHPDDLVGRRLLKPKSPREIAEWRKEQGIPEQAAPEVAPDPAEAVKSEMVRDVEAPPAAEPAVEPVVETPAGRVTIQPDLVDRIGKAISPQAAFEDLKKHGAGDGKPLPASDARAMVDMVWKAKDPAYKSIEQWMMERRDKWDAERQASPSSRSGNADKGVGAALADALKAASEKPNKFITDDALSEAVKTIKKKTKGGTTHGELFGLDPEHSAAMIKVGLYYVERGVTTSAELGKALVKHFGPDALKVLEDVWDAVNRRVVAWHGSPHKFDKFEVSDKTIGTGEGAQAYGHGGYLAESPAVAQQYRSNLSGRGEIKSLELAGAKVGEFNGFDYSPKGNSIFENIRSSLIENLLINETELIAARASGLKEHVLKVLDEEAANSTWAEAVPHYKQLRKLIEKQGVRLEMGEEPGALYKLDLPAAAVDRMLDWDKPLSEQPASVQKALAKAYKDRGMPMDGDTPAFFKRDPKGEALYSSLHGMGDAGTAAELMKRAGIPGIKYLDAGSRPFGDAPRGTRNFVVFDDKFLRTLERNGEKLKTVDDLPKMKRTKKEGKK